MKVVALNGSPREKGNTAILIGHVFQELEREGIKTELVQLGSHLIQGCNACYECYAKKNKRCAIEADIVNDCIQKMSEADGIVLGSPTYVAGITSEMTALIDRSCLVARANGDLFRRKVGAAVVAVRRAGATHAFDTINHFFGITQMITVGSCYWNLAIGREPGDVESDEEGIRTMKILGQNMAWLLKRLGAS